MEKRLTRGEKWLFVSPILFLVIAAAAWQWRQAAPEKIQLAQPAYVGRLEFSPDNQRLLVHSENLASRQIAVQISDLATRGRVCELDKLSIPSGRYEILNPVWSNDGKSIAARTYSARAGKTSEQISIWDATSGALKIEYPRVDKTYETDWQRARIRFSPDGKTLIDKGVPPARYDVATGKRLNKADENYSRKYAELNEKLGLLTLRNLRDETFKVIDYKTKQELWQPKVVVFRYSAWHGDVLCLSVIGRSKSPLMPPLQRLWLWDGKTRAPLPSPPVPSGATTFDYDLHPATNTLVYSQYTYQIDPQTKGPTHQKYELVAWDYRASRELWRTELNSQPLYLQLSPDGKKLAALTPLDLNIGQRYRLHVFDQNGERIYTHKPVGNTIRWSSDSKKLATADANDIEGGNPLTHYIEIHRFDDE